MNENFDLDFTNPTFDLSSMGFRCLAAGGLWVTISTFLSHPLTIFLLGIAVTVGVEVYKSKRASRNSQLALKNAFNSGKLKAYEEMGIIPKNNDDTPTSFDALKPLPIGEGNPSPGN